MKLFLVLLFINISLFSSDILTSYRINGIGAIEKQMDLELTKEEYWSNYIKDKDTTFGYIASYTNIITCNKNNSTLNLYSTYKNSTFKLKTKYGAFTGKLEGDKVKEGDLKTTIGIYQIVKKLSKETKLNSFYGPLAFVTSYPNVYDSYRGKNGSGIWIHGLPIEQKRDEFTRGCIAINNTNIECLDDNINIEKTLLIIDGSKIKKNISKKTLTSILSKFYTWRYAWLYNDIDSYLDFYSDGRYIGCVLDRNGLRPSKYIVTNDDNLLIASEYGVVNIPEDEIKERGRLQSGEMLGLDLKFGKLLKSNEIDDYLKISNTYMKWLNEHMIYLQEHVEEQYLTQCELATHDIVKRQRYFNVTQEIVEQVIEPMIIDSKEAVGSMGDDTPLAAFSNKQRNFTDYFKQKFTQVTNPPIDPIREKVVMSLNTGFGEV